MMVFFLIGMSVTNGEDKKLEWTKEAYEKAQSDLAKQYVKALSRIRLKHVESGDLEKERAVMAEIVKAKQKIILSKIEVKDLVVGEWTVKSGTWTGYLSLNSRGEAKYKDGVHKGEWKVDGNVLHIDWSHGGFDNFSIPVDGAMTGRNKRGSFVTATKKKYLASR